MEDGATALPASGTTLNFNTLQTITITSQAGTLQEWLVTVVMNVGQDRQVNFDQTSGQAIRR